jgi:hypothetical protein
MNIDFGQRTVATLRLQVEGQISAWKEFDCVTLQIPIRTEIYAEPTSTWLCQNIALELFGVQPGGSERLICAGPMNEVLEPRRGHYAFDRQVPFRCTPNAIAEYENLRSGNPVMFRLKFRGQIHELQAGTEHRKMLCEPLNVWGQEDVVADKAKWIAALRSAGLSVSVLFEVPLPVTGEIQDEALIALKSAFSSFENGGTTAWKDSVGHLRAFLEKWKKAQSNTSPETKDGSAADREWKLLNLRDGLLKCCHFWMHEAASECGRDDALLILSTFAALLKSHRSVRRS